MRLQGLGASAPQPVGASGQLGKEQALPCAENLFSWCGVRLGEYDGMPHGGTCPSSAELPEFLQRQEPEQDLKPSFTEGRNPFRFHGERNSGLAISNSDVLSGPGGY